MVTDNHGYYWYMHVVSGIAINEFKRFITTLLNLVIPKGKLSCNFHHEK